VLACPNSSRKPPGRRSGYWNEQLFHRGYFDVGVLCGTTHWFASDFAIENRLWIRQHPLGLLTPEGGSDRDRVRAWHRPAGPAGQAVLVADAEVRDLAAAGPWGDHDQRGRDRFEVDRSTIMRLRTVAKDGALAALAESRPGVQQAKRDVELEAARAQAARSARRSRSWPSG
jgi:hypothetical protein